MARPRSEDKRLAILAAAVRVMASQGVAAPTALIAQEAGVSNGTLFVYFPTKVDLHNQLYVELKTEMATEALAEQSDAMSDRKKLRTAWEHWLAWAVAFPEKRRVLALLGVSDDITPSSLQTGHRVMAPIAQMLDRARQDGPMRDAPLPFVAGLMNALADVTIEFIHREPDARERRSAEAFEALWRILR